MRPRDDHVSLLVVTRSDLHTQPVGQPGRPRGWERITWAADCAHTDFKALYVPVFIAHGRRELVHRNVTADPTAAWGWRQFIEATPGDAHRGICCAIEIPSLTATSADAPDASTPSPRRFTRRPQMVSRSQ
jgi:hypothetical protein